MTRGIVIYSARDLKFPKLKTNMAARGLLHKTLFPLSLVSCLGCRLVLPSKTFNLQAISNAKNPILLNRCVGT